MHVYAHARDTHTERERARVSSTARARDSTFVTKDHVDGRPVCEAENFDEHRRDEEKSASCPGRLAEEESQTSTKFR